MTSVKIQTTQVSEVHQKMVLVLSQGRNLLRASYKQATCSTMIVSAMHACAKHAGCKKYTYQGYVEVPKNGAMMRGSFRFVPGTLAWPSGPSFDVEVSKAVSFLLIP